MTRIVVIWICGLLASGIIGGLIGNQLHYSDGGFYGFTAGALMFICVRLWLGGERHA